MPSQNEYNVTKQKGRIIHTKIYLLNYKLQRVDELSGVVLDGATFNVDANSDIRRTCSISLVPKNSSFDVKFGSKIWLDKYVQIYIGIEDNKNNNEIAYTNMGIYLVNNPSQIYDASNNTITINGIDMMAKLTGLRNGNLEGIEYQVKAGSSIKGAMESMLQLCGFTKYRINSPTPTPNVPNDIAISIGGTAYDLLNQLANINANYQMYFDENGVFYYNQIPSGNDEQIMVNDDIWKDTLISYNTSISFENVKNYIEVFGKTLANGKVPYGVAYESNEKSPFYINGNLGKIRIVLSGGEYENIYSNSLAQQRANYELYLRCRLQDQISISCVPIYWLDVNWLVEITLPNKQGIEETNKYMIKSVNTTLGASGTQSITLMKYYPFYPFVSGGIADDGDDDGYDGMFGWNDLDDDNGQDIDFDDPDNFDDESTLCIDGYTFKASTVKQSWFANDKQKSAFLKFCKNNSSYCFVRAESYGCAFWAIPYFDIKGMVVPNLNGILNGEMYSEDGGVLYGYLVYFDEDGKAYLYIKNENEKDDKVLIKDDFTVVLDEYIENDRIHCIN